MPFGGSGPDNNTQSIGQAFNTQAINQRVFLPIIGPDVNGSTVEADHQILLFDDGFLLAIGLFVTVNTRVSDTEFRLNVNGVEALKITFGPGATGSFKVQGNIPYKDGDLINWESVEIGGTGGGYTLQSASLLVSH